MYLAKRISKNFIKLKLPIIGGFAKFRLTGNERNICYYIDKCLNNNTGFYFAFLGPSNDNLTEILKRCLYGNSTLPFLFELNKRSSRYLSCVISRVDKYIDFNVKSSINSHNITALDLNPKNFIQTGNKLIEGSIYVINDGSS